MSTELCWRFKQIGKSISLAWDQIQLALPRLRLPSSFSSFKQTFDKWLPHSLLTKQDNSPRPLPLDDLCRPSPYTHTRISETITNILLPIYHQQLNGTDARYFISREERARKAGGDECERNEVESTVRKREEG